MYVFVIRDFILLYSQKNNDSEDKTPLSSTAPRTVDVEPGPR